MSRRMQWLRTTVLHGEIIMTEPIYQSAIQIKEIVEACRTLAESIQSEDEKERAFSMTVVAYVHEYLFKVAPKEAVKFCNKVEYPH